MAEEEGPPPDFRTYEEGEWPYEGDTGDYEVTDETGLGDDDEDSADDGASSGSSAESYTCLPSSNPNSPQTPLLQQMKLEVAPRPPPQPPRGELQISWRTLKMLSHRHRGRTMPGRCVPARADARQHSFSH